jgi:acyl carrier protein
MTDQEFLELLNEVAKKAKPFNNELTFIDSMDMRLNETGLDSLDILTCAIHLCEIYDVEEEQSKEMFGETPRDFLEFLKKWGRKQPSFPRTN